MFVHRSTNICTIGEFSTTHADTHESKKEAMPPLLLFFDESSCQIFFGAEVSCQE